MKKKHFYLLFSLIFALYLLVTFLIPPDTRSLDKYHISLLQLRLISLTFVLPIGLIWYASVYGFVRFYAYAQKIIKSPDGRAFSKIAAGLSIWAFVSPVNSIVTAILNYIGRSQPLMLPTVTILQNYISMLISFSAFLLIFLGTKALAEEAQVRIGTSARWWIIATSLLAIAYIYLVFANPARQVAPEGVLRASYYLEDWLIVSTIVLPYIASWFLGLFAALHLTSYAAQVKGVIYKQSLGLLVKGLLVVVGVSVFVQFLSTQTVSLSRVSLVPLLGLIYILLVFIALGYVLIAKGAKKLQKIEEV